MEFEFIAPPNSVIYKEYLSKLTGLSKANFELANVKGFIRYPSSLKKVKRLFAEYCQEMNFPLLQIILHVHHTDLIYDGPFLSPYISKECLSKMESLIPNTNPRRKKQYFINSALVQIYNINRDLAVVIAGIIIQDRMRHLGAGKTVWERKIRKLLEVNG